MGVEGVVVVEQNKITSGSHCLVLSSVYVVPTKIIIFEGTTWHAAGLMVTFGSTSETSTELRKYSKQLYRTLEQETGLSTGAVENSLKSTMVDSKPLTPHSHLKVSGPWDLLN